MRIDRLVCFFAALGLASSASGSDGVLEINQTCAVETGCFAGDTTGFPVTIPASGSYRLTSNLVVPNENTGGIQVDADNVSIDLAGFAIRGPVVCSGLLTVCTPSTGTGTGVQATVRGVSVKNGSVTGMGNFGVLLGEESEVKNLQVRWNRLDGIKADAGSVVVENRAVSNGRTGIDVATASTAMGNVANRNGGDGLRATVIANVANNMSYFNVGNGITVGNGSVVSGNATRDNFDDGINAGEGCTIVDNTAFFNGDGAPAGEDDGIDCELGCIVRGNSARRNRGYGVRLGEASGYRENVVLGNFSGQVTGGVDAGANVINGVVTSTP